MGCWVALQSGSTTSSYTVLCILLLGVGPGCRWCALGCLVCPPGTGGIVFLLTRRASLSFRPGVSSAAPPLMPLLGFLSPLFGLLVLALSWRLALRPRPFTRVVVFATYDVSMGTLM